LLSVNTQGIGNVRRFHTKPQGLKAFKKLSLGQNANTVYANLHEKLSDADPFSAKEIGIK
jgi:hypothetical protein